MMYAYIIGASALAVGIIRIVYNRLAGRCHSRTRLDGKTTIVTGASAGIGKETALDFAKRGARVILACRNLEKAQKVADEIIRTSGNPNVVVRELDTSKLNSVRQFANHILQTEDRLDILVNNAGMPGPSSRTLTADGLEMTMAANHYGHFLLTNILIKLLESSSPSRIINVSSNVHLWCSKIDPEDINFQKTPYGSLEAYSQSKLCNVLFSLELSEKLRGSGVVANCIHPGVVHTEISLKIGGVYGYVRHVLYFLMAKDAALGAQTTIYVAVSDDVKNATGKYFVDCQEAACSKLASHRGMSKKLWLASELDVTLEPDESPLYT